MPKQLKPITEISNEELLDLLKDDSSQTSNFQYQNDILEFISFYQITQGDYKITARLLYKLYKYWSKSPISQNSMSNDLALFFAKSSASIFLINKPREFFLEKSSKKKVNKTKRKQWFKHFKGFIEKYNLKSGRFFVKDIVLYNLYDKWTYKNNNHNPLSLPQFIKFCRLFFHKPYPKEIKGSMWFSVDSEIQEYFTPDLINLMRKK